MYIRLYRTSSFSYVSPTHMASPHSIINLIKGELTPNQKLACFVLYLKIINTILKNDICILK